MSEVDLKRILEENVERMEATLLPSAQPVLGIFFRHPFQNDELVKSASDIYLKSRSATSIFDMISSAMGTSKDWNFLTHIAGIVSNPNFAIQFAELCRSRVTSLNEMKLQLHSMESTTDRKDVFI